MSSALRERYRVIGLDVVKPREEIPGVEWIECDLTSPDNTTDALRVLRELGVGDLASVVHLAAYYDFSGAPSDLYQRLTIDGTKLLLGGLQDFNVGQIVFSSTLLVMEPSDEGEVIDERSPTEATWDYPRSKLAAEQAMAAFRVDIPAVILRIAGVYDDDCGSIPIARQIQRIFEHSFESHFYPGDKDHGQPFIHLDDLVECMRHAIDRRADFEPWELFLIAEDELLSYGELQDLIGELVHGTRWRTIRIPKFVAKAGAWVMDNLSTEEQFIKPWMIDLADDHFPVDTSKFKLRLGWRPRRSLRETLPEMIARLKNDPARWYETNGLGEPPESVLESAGRQARSP
jgi:nucleoside-diphosphate-sugar epimerase